MSDIHKRTAFLVKKFGPNPNAFAVKAGVRVQRVHFIIGARKTKPHYRFIYKVLTTFPEVSPAWYCLGKGKWNDVMGKPNKILVKLQAELDEYKHLYRVEKFINNALRNKIRKIIKK